MDTDRPKKLGGRVMGARRSMQKHKKNKHIQTKPKKPKCTESNLSEVAHKD